MNEKIFIVPNNDLEAKGIIGLLKNNGYEEGKDLFITNQTWGASWDNLEQKIKDVIVNAGDKTKIYGVELQYGNAAQISAILDKIDISEYNWPKKCIQLDYFDGDAFTKKALSEMSIDEKIKNFATCLSQVMDNKEKTYRGAGVHAGRLGYVYETDVSVDTVLSRMLFDHNVISNLTPCPLEEAASVIIAPQTSDYYENSKGKIPGVVIPVKEQVEILNDRPIGFTNRRVYINGEYMGKVDDRENNSDFYGRRYNTFSYQPSVLSREEFTLLQQFTETYRRCCNIDHHIYNGDNRLNEQVYESNSTSVSTLASIEQVAQIIDVELSTDQIFIAANDRGYIPEMRKLGEQLRMTPDEIDVTIQEIRMLDRQAQGVTKEQEQAAVKAIEAAGVSAEGIVESRNYTVYLEHSKCSTVTDRLYGQYDNLLIICADGELDFYGQGDICKDLQDRFGGWSGGDLSTSGFWGGYVNPQEVQDFLAEEYESEISTRDEKDIGDEE